jgi:hypothetical protein
MVNGCDIPIVLNFHNWFNNDCNDIYNKVEELSKQYEGRIKIILADVQLFEH